LTHKIEFRVLENDVDRTDLKLHLSPLFWILAHPFFSKNPSAAYDFCLRYLSAPPALGEKRPPFGAWRFEIQWAEHQFRRDRVQPEKFPIRTEEKSWVQVDILAIVEVQVHLLF
jgi:hypothetical protein